MSGLSLTGEEGGGLPWRQLRPMEPVAVPEPIDNPGFGYQVKWDGVRILAFYAGGPWHLQNRRLHDRTGQYPEAGQALREVLRERRAILDGEMVVILDGKPSFSRVMERDRGRKEDTIKALQRRLPATLVVFDLLFLDGRSLLSVAWDQRQALLADLWPGPTSPHVHLAENFTDGPRLFRAVEDRGLEGIVAKKRDGPYLPGRKSPLWLKIKCRRTQLVAVGGFTLTGGRVGALLLGAFREGEFLYLGRAGSGLKEMERELLARHLRQETRPDSPFHNLRRRPASWYWVEPRLTVEVEFMEWTSDLKFRAPVIVGFAGASPTACQV